ncbi:MULTISPECIES: AAA family ATPase [Streptomyces]|uniref:MinD/ParA family protein n=1 Tax=Streptomyces lycii TaxID=2654337 RepID=A0ABQ7FBS8_9ACTN|nr:MULTISPECIES: AAA family ATPase [Streptomyces]KAF4406075.1 MinD/ParA family protein [Streptomyces lycii]PGH48482.1 septum formation initiator [Streptomyces sp. Ru87]
MTTRILPAVGDADAARSVTTLLGRLPGAEPAPPVTDSTALLDTLARLAGEGVGELPEVVLVHERIGPVPALELIRETALRFPAVGVVLLSADTAPGLLQSAMDSGARGLVGLPLSYEELAARVHSAAQWASGVRRHLGAPPEEFTGPGGTVVTVTGAKGGVGTTFTAVQLALAARASGHTTALVDMDLQSGDVASFLDVQFRRSVVDLAGITDLSPRVLQDAVFAHPTGLGLLLAPVDGERGEEVTDRAARQIVSSLRSRYEVVVVDCGTQMNGANAAAVEMSDTALMVTTPDVVAVRAAKRLVRLWDRLQIRKAEETLTVVNRHSRQSEIQPALVERITGTRVSRTAVPANFRELQPVVDAGRVQDLDNRSQVKQALWRLAGELGLVKGAVPDPAGRPPARGGRKAPGGRGTLGLAPRRRRGGDSGQAAVEFLGMVPLLLVVLALCWQCALLGYTYSLAGNSADEAARAATAAASSGACRPAAEKNLPGAWREGASISCSRDGGLWRARVALKVPVLFPGSVDFPVTVTGEAGAAEEG